MNNIEKFEHRSILKSSAQAGRLQASVLSELIKCNYYLRVSVEYSGVCITNKPVVEIPVIIYIPHVKLNVETYKPEFWDPVVMPVVGLDLPTAKQLGLYKGFSNQSLGNFHNKTLLNDL